MKRRNPYRKFQGQQDKIEKLEKSNSRFKRVFSEYEFMAEELWDLNNIESNIPDDFLDSILVQTSFLEKEIEQWLDVPDSNSKNIEKE